MLISLTISLSGMGSDYLACLSSYAKGRSGFDAYNVLGEISIINPDGNNPSVEESSSRLALIF